MQTSKTKLFTNSNMVYVTVTGVRHCKREEIRKEEVKTQLALGNNMFA